MRRFIDNQGTGLTIEIPCDDLGSYFESDVSIYPASISPTVIASNSEEFRVVNVFDGGEGRYAAIAVESVATGLARIFEDERYIPEKHDPMLTWFKFEHLPPHLQSTSKQFHDLARHVVDTIKPGNERTVALRKLLEAKDAAVRAVVSPGS